MNVVLACYGPGWLSIARLAKPLRNAGFSVTACGPADALLMKSRYIDYMARITPASPDDVWAALRSIHTQVGVDLLIPGDEAMIALLHHFITHPHGQQDETDRAVTTAIVASLGNPAMYGAMCRKSHLASLPNTDVWRFPVQAVVDPSANLFAAAEALGYPVMVKLDFTAGGTGVYEVDGEATMRRLATERDAFELLAPNDARLKDGRLGVVQRLIRGRSASVSLVARDGALLRAFAYEKVEGHGGRTGPATVSRAVHRPDLPAAARYLTRHFGFTGFAGVDFVIDDETDLPFVIEFNARPTLTTHLGAVFGCDLCVALHAAMAGVPPPPTTPALAAMVAMFPGEWRRNPDSDYLHRAYHDVPWDDRGVLNAILAGEHGL